MPYLLAYLVTGYAASFGDILLRPGSNLPGVGASGAISGVLGMYFIWFPRKQVRLLVLIPPIVQVIDVGARLVLGFYIVVQNLLPTLLGVSGWNYFLAAVALGAVMLLLAARFATRRSVNTARWLFFGSITYLPLIWLAMILDH